MGQAGAATIVRYRNIKRLPSSPARRFGLAVTLISTGGAIDHINHPN